MKLGTVLESLWLSESRYIHGAHENRDGSICSQQGIRIFLETTRCLGNAVGHDLEPDLLLVNAYSCY